MNSSRNYRCVGLKHRVLDLLNHQLARSIFWILVVFTWLFTLSAIKYWLEGSTGNSYRGSTATTVAILGWTVCLGLVFGFQFVLKRSERDFLTDPVRHVLYKQWLDNRLLAKGGTVRGYMLMVMGALIFVTGVTAIILSRVAIEEDVDLLPVHNHIELLVGVVAGFVFSALGALLFVRSNGHLKTKFLRRALCDLRKPVMILGALEFSPFEK